MHCADASPALSAVPTQMRARGVLTVAGAAALVVLIGVSGTAFVVPPARLNAAPYADWAHKHWVWLSSDRANQSSMLAYAQEYLDHNISVGAVDIDSAWSTGFNNFIINTEKYPDAGAMISQFHGMGMKVIFWMTSMIDTDSSNYQTAIDNHYYVENALGGPGIIKWWHGHGVLLDYTNPAAVEWWHSLLKTILDLGLDGWKTDGTDPYILELLDAKGTNGSHIKYRSYADDYYGDCFDYTRSVNGPETLIMSRPVDGWAPIYLPFSPRRVVFSGWIGDNDPTWSGLVDAMKKLLFSGWWGYPSFGCDIGGYRQGDHTAEVFTRWYQLGTFMGLMENGGDDEHRPWMFDPPGSTNISDNYRTCVNLHTSLTPYLMTTVTQAYEDGGSSVVPVAPDATFQETLIDAFDPPTYDYFLGPSIFVSPIATPAGNQLSLIVHFPEGQDWINWFDASRTPYHGGQNLTFDAPMNVYPAFYCVGCVVPLRITTNDIGRSGRDWLIDPRLKEDDAAVTFVVNRPQPAGASVEVRQFKRNGITMSYRVVTTNTETGARTITVTVSATQTPVVLAFEDVGFSSAGDQQLHISQRRAGSSDAVELRCAHDRSELHDSRSAGYYYDAATSDLLIRPAAPEVGVELTITGTHNL